MRIPVKSAILYSPLFMNGVNLGDKIGSTGEKPVKIQYDSELRLLFVQYKGGAAVISIDGGVASFMPKDQKDIDLEPWPELAIVPTPPERQSRKAESAEVIRAQHPVPMSAPRSLPVNPAQVENPAQPKAGRKTNA